MPEPEAYHLSTDQHVSIRELVEIDLQENGSKL